MFDYCTHGEAKAAKALIARILSAGCCISVNDSYDGGGEWTVVKSEDFNEICEALNTTEGDMLSVRVINGERIGFISLIWGNDPDGSELVSDYSATARMESLCEA